MAIAKTCLTIFHANVLMEQAVIHTVKTAAQICIRHMQVI
jgi:hypothetical protein